MKKILAVDDHPAILEILKVCLEERGYAVTTAFDGHAALGMIERELFQAVLLDLGLKDMRGMEVLREIKKQTPRLPVLVITGCHEESEARCAFELGALEYITKPVDFEYLCRVLEFQLQN